MTKKVVLLVASNGFQQDEYHETYKALVKAGIQVTTASDKQGKAVAHDGSTVQIDCLMSAIVPALYDGLFLIGGRGALTCLDTPLVYKVLNEMVAVQKPYGAICISPRILAKAQVLQGKRATCWDGDQQAQAVFKEHGVTFVHEHVVIDGKVVTADGPLAAPAFGQAIATVV